jgi:nucleoside-diphosphate-sugar epimerase
MSTTTRRPASSVNDFLKQYNGLRVVVTGGTGFIGRLLTEKLVSAGAHVSIIDNRLDDRIGPLLNSERLTVYEADITENASIAPAFDNSQIVFHAASAINNRLSNIDYFTLLNTEILGILNVLSLAAREKARRIVMSSSSLIYNCGKPATTNRNHAESGGISAPALAKLIAEEYCRTFNEKYGLDYTILRYFGVYGPGQNDSSVISRFVREVFDHKPFFNPDGEWQTSDFIYIEDAVNMTLIAGLKEETRNQAIDIGSGNSTSIIELASLITHAYDKNQAINLEYADAGEMPSTENESDLPSADISRTRKLLQYKPLVSLESGIKRYLDWYRNKYESDLNLV